MPYLVTVADYDPRWPAMFEAERARVVAALAPVTVWLEHVGGTSVPGLAAKPIIDILIGVRELAQADAWIEPLGGIGYRYVPAAETVLPERRFFVRGDYADRQTYHLHLVRRGGPEWESLVQFRDALRARPDLARAYGELKRALAAQPIDNRAFGAGKAPFIERVIAEARSGGPSYTANPPHESHTG